MIEDERELRLYREMRRFQHRLPNPLAQAVRWLRIPRSRYVRIPAGVALTAGGFVGFLPILGFWMIPLGLVLLAQDIPALRAPMARLLRFINRRLPPRETSPSLTGGTRPGGE